MVLPQGICNGQRQGEQGYDTGKQCAAGLPWPLLTHSQGTPISRYLRLPLLALPLTGTCMKA